MDAESVSAAVDVAALDVETVAGDDADADAKCELVTDVVRLGDIVAVTLVESDAEVCADEVPQRDASEELVMVTLGDTDDDDASDVVGELRRVRVGVVTAVDDAHGSAVREEDAAPLLDGQLVD